jgi:hypothetical protein
MSNTQASTVLIFKSAGNFSTLTKPNKQLDKTAQERHGRIITTTNNGAAADSRAGAAEGEGAGGH